MAKQVDKEHEYDPTAILTEVLGAEIAGHAGFKADVADVLMKLNTFGAKETLTREAKVIAPSQKATTE